MDPQSNTVVTSTDVSGTIGHGGRRRAGPILPSMRPSANAALPDGARAERRTHPPQRADAARRPLRVARPPPVAQHVHVELELGAARCEREEGVVLLLRARP